MRLSKKGQMDHFRISLKTLYILCIESREIGHGVAYAHFTRAAKD